MNFSIVIPVLNEAPNIEPLCRDIARALCGRFNFEALIVDDGSTDDTLDRLSKAQARHSDWLRVLHHQETRGQSAALHTGAAYARSSWIVTMDGDGQNDPADIPNLFAARDRAAAGVPVNMVCGIRTRRRDNMVRRVSSRIANGIRSRVLRDNVSDTGCGLKLIERECLLDLPCFDHMHRFLPALAAARGFGVICVPVSHRPRLFGHSKYGISNRLWVGIVDLLGVAWLNSRIISASVEEITPALAMSADREDSSRHAGDQENRFRRVSPGRAGVAEPPLGATHGY